MLIHIHNEDILLGVEKYIYLPKYKAIVISDMHLGKIDHFRKHGIALPKSGADVDLHNLQTILGRYEIEQCIFLGDLFHSDHNVFWDQFADFISSYRGIDFILVQGNHDVLSDKRYRDAGIQLVPRMILGELLLTHDREPSEGLYNIHGHIHPGIVLRGKGRQTLRLPCFFFDTGYGVMPAFGRFTGLYTMSPSKTSEIYSITQTEILHIPS